MTRPNVLQKLLFGLFYDHDTVSDDPLNGILYIVGASTFLGKIKWRGEGPGQATYGEKSRGICIDHSI